MTADIKVTWKLLITYLVCTARTDSVRVMMSVGKAVLGKSGTIHCSADFQTDEIQPELEMSSKRLGLRFVWTQNSSIGYTDIDTSRYIVVVDTAVANTVLITLNIEQLVCGDEGSYVCTATAVVANTTLTVQTSQQVELRVQVPVSAPTKLVVTPEALVVKEHDWVDVECRAVSGHTNGTRLAWKLYQGNHVELVPPRDPRIILQEANNMSGDSDCLRQVTSRLRIVMTRGYHGCQVACFVWNRDVQPSLPPHCDHEEKDLCAKTPRLQVHYGVREETMQLYIIPESEVVDGATISVVCHADGYPPANYTWDRSPPLELSANVVISMQDGNTSQLLLASFDSKNDTGIYRCTAWNWVMGVEYFTASQDIFVSANSPVQKHGSLFPHLTPLNKLASFGSRPLAVGV